MSEPDKAGAKGQAAAVPLCGPALRSAAELALRERDARSAPAPQAASPEASEQTLHELRVHQIELEMQNEELHRRQREIDALSKRYFDLYDLAPVGYCTLNEAGLIVQTNLTASTLLGVTRGALMKQRFSRFIFEPDEDIFYQLRKTLLKTGLAQSADLRMLKPDGTPFWAQLVANVVQDNAGVPQLRLVLSDISERKRDQQALREEQALLQKITSSSPVGIVVVHRSGRITLANLAAESILGLKRDQITQRSYDAPDWKNTDLQGKVLPNEELPVSRVLTSGAPVFEVEHAIEWPDGRRVLISVNASPMLDAAGQIDSVVAAVSNITERKRREQLMAESEARFRGLVEQSLTGIYTSRDGVFLYANPRLEQLLGYGHGELTGIHADEIVLAEDLPILQAQRDILRAGAASSAYEVRARRRDGSVVELGVQGSIYMVDGQPTTIGMAQDITEKRRDEQRIADYVVQLKSALMSAVDVARIMSEMRDPYTAGHQRRVGDLAGAIGTELGLDADRVEGLRVAGNLHDVGKITVPSEILSRPGKLSALEYQMIQAHAQAGYEVLKGVQFPWPLAEVALQHHERLDGSGYPQGLMGDAILLEARIMAVADVVEAIASHRPYRAALGLEAALAEIESGSGCRFDPAVVQACLKLFREKSYTLTA